MRNPDRELKPEKCSSSLEPTVENVRRSCLALVASPKCRIKIHTARARAFAENLQPDELRKYPHHMESTLEFSDKQTEANFHIVLHLFNFEHSYRHPLHSVRKAGAWQTMKRGVEKLQQQTPDGLIRAETLTRLSLEQVVSIFDLEDRKESGKRSGRVANSLKPLAEMILAIAHDSGRRLLDAGFSDFASFAESHSRDPETGQLSAAWLVHELAENFPEFNDRRIWHDGREILFLKKAQIVVAELYQRLGADYPEFFGFPDIKKLTVVCDNVLPCVLRSLGVLVIPDELLYRIDTGQPLPAGPDEAELRVAAVAAVEIMLEHGRGKFWDREIGDFLWSLGKEPRYRSVDMQALSV